MPEFKDITETFYDITLKTLKTMTRAQLLELFNDIGDIAIVDRIAEVSNKFVEYHMWKHPQDACAIIRGKSDEQDARELDQAQRYRDYKNEI